jgi:bifunctional DNA-binding transcriptional regulator/antitoxin component of YhaV-PrlF toxin-antitoxin module
MNQQWTLTVQEDPQTGDSILEFPPEVLEAAGWKEGDVIEWKNLNDGSWGLTKKEEDKDVLYEYVDNEYSRIAVVYQKDNIYGVRLYDNNLLVEDRKCAGKSLHFADDLAINWVDRIGEFNTK